MKQITIGEGSYLLVGKDMNYVLFRSNIPIRMDSETLVYMVKLEAEKEGYKVPLQAQVPLRQIIAAEAKGQSALHSILSAMAPLVTQKWGAEGAELLAGLTQA